MSVCVRENETKRERDRERETERERERDRERDRESEREQVISVERVHFSLRGRMSVSILSTLEVVDAPEPSNIMFQNYKYSKEELNLRQKSSLFFSFLLVAVSAFIVYATKIGQVKLIPPPDPNCPVGLCVGVVLFCQNIHHPSWLRKLIISFSLRQHLFGHLTIALLVSPGMSESDISLTTNHFFIECYCLAQGFSMVRRENVWRVIRVRVVCEGVDVRHDKL